MKLPTSLTLIALVIASIFGFVTQMNAAETYSQDEMNQERQESVQERIEDTTQSPMCGRAGC